MRVESLGQSRGRGSAAPVQACSRRWTARHEKPAGSTPRGRQATVENSLSCSCLVLSCINYRPYKSLQCRLQTTGIDNLLGPLERRGLGVVDLDECIDRGAQVGDIRKAGAPQRGAGQDAEPAFDQIQPAGVGRRKV